MRRRALFAIIFVLVGLLTTTAIAWSAAWWRPMATSVTMVVEGPEEDLWYLGSYDSGPAWTMTGTSGAVIKATPEMIKDFGAETPPAWMPRPPETDGNQYGAVSLGVGWPMVCFVATCDGIAHHEPPPGRAWHTGVGAQWVEWIEWHGALGSPEPTDPRGPTGQRIIPIGFRLVGLLGNVAFWTSAWWIPFAGFSAVRHRRRAKRGRCPACGYDLRGDLGAGCSECGWGRASESS